MTDSNKDMIALEGLVRSTQRLATNYATERQKVVDRYPADLVKQQSELGQLKIAFYRESEKIQTELDGTLKRWKDRTATSRKFDQEKVEKELTALSTTLASTDRDDVVSVLLDHITNGSVETIYGLSGEAGIEHIKKALGRTNPTNNEMETYLPMVQRAATTRLDQLGRVPDSSGLTKKEKEFQSFYELAVSRLAHDVNEAIDRGGGTVLFPSLPGSDDEPVLIRFDASPTEDAIAARAKEISEQTEEVQTKHRPPLIEAELQENAQKADPQ